MEQQTTSSYEQERRHKREQLREMGLDPYGQRTEAVQPLAEVKSLYKPEMGHDGGPAVKAAGRVMLKRDMGKLSFLTLRDETGDLQVALDKKRLDETAWQVNSLIDLGDLLVVEGPLGVTRKGEITIWATAVSVASKALLPPPAKWEGLSDVELRYRQRYVDLWANPDVMRILKLRMAIVDEIRSFMKGRGFAEVETPMMQALAGGAAARPFTTHHNALNIPLYLRIAPELYLKRLLVGGFNKVFELNRNFRNEGISPRHNPEFTMLEAYEAFGSWETMAELVESMICHIAQKVMGTLKIEHHDATGKRAVDAYMNGTGASLEGICKARLDLLDSQEGRNPFLVLATPAEHEARRTASEGYERGQPGFDAFLQEIADSLAGKTREEQRLHLLKAFIIKRINLTRPWKRVRLVDLVREYTGWKFTKHSLQKDEPAFLKVVEMMTERMHSEGRHKMAQHVARTTGLTPAQTTQLEHNVHMRPGTAEQIARVLSALEPAEQLQQVYEKLIEPTLIDPTFVTHVPSVIIPLARENKQDPFFADVYELAINGQEISPGYTELNDPDVQEKHFHHQVGDKEEQQKVDEDFLTALKYGMPPAGGMGLGVDRLAMMLTGAESIRDVILFPLMRPVD